jgi:hypothetical protein
VSLEIKRSWRPLDVSRVSALPAQLGVFEIADATGLVLFVGCAGGRSPFGLRGALVAEAQRPRPGAAQFRYEVTMQYSTRWRELLMGYVAHSGNLPRDNRVRGEHPHRLGRLSPA